MPIAITMCAGLSFPGHHTTWSDAAGAARGFAYLRLKSSSHR